MALYPGGSIKSKEWLSIRSRIQTRAKDCCEGCGVQNGAIGYRDPTGRFHAAPHLPPGYLVPGYAKRPPKVFRIVCTVAHVDGDETNNGDANLRFWCQRCHNRHDAPARAAGRKERRQ
jgi:hypothetical protein